MFLNFQWRLCKRITNYQIRPKSRFNLRTVLYIGVARIFSGAGALFSWPKSWWPFFSHHPLLHGHIRHILPPTTFLSHLRGCTSPNSVPFCLIPTKMPRIFFRRPGGAGATPWLRLWALWYIRSQTEFWSNLYRRGPNACRTLRNCKLQTMQIRFCFQARSNFIDSWCEHEIQIIACVTVK